MATAIAAFARNRGPVRAHLSCGNQAHAYAAMGAPKGTLAEAPDPWAPNLGIVTAYNDMLSAHQPYERYPDLIRAAARRRGPRRRSRAGFRRCATASPRASRGWSFRSFPAT
jgi:phosphogluconate dehydratase